MSRTGIKRRKTEFGMAVLGGWTFHRDTTAYEHGEWYAVPPGVGHNWGARWLGPYKARWMAVDAALITMEVKNPKLMPKKIRERPLRVERYGRHGMQG